LFYNAGDAYANGNGVKRDYKKAIEYHDKACDKKLAESCLAIASIYIGGDGIEDDHNKAFEYSKKACGYGLKEGCFIWVRS
jgi:TPR repeat protein